MVHRLTSATLRSVLFVGVLLLAVVLSTHTEPAVALSAWNSGDPSGDEQLVLEMINHARADPVAEGHRLKVNPWEGLCSTGSYACPGGTCVAANTPPLAMNAILSDAGPTPPPPAPSGAPPGSARFHNWDMSTNSFFGHSDTYYGDWAGRISAFGYPGSYIGENIAAYSTAADSENNLVTDSGTTCRGHRWNLFNSGYREVGIGWSYGYLTEDFGSSSTGPFLVGVVYDDANGNNFYDPGEGISGVTITATPNVGYYAVSSTSGGYAFPIGTSGTITVSASAAGFPTVTKTVTLTGANVKVDFTKKPSNRVQHGDLVVWRPSSGTWYIRHQDGWTWSKQWGKSGDVPLVGDVDGDGFGDLIIWRPSNGYWYVLKSTASYSTSSAWTKQWGKNGDTPLVGDVDEDEHADLIIWRPSNGYWYALKSTASYSTSSALKLQWGKSGDTPLVGRFDYSDIAADFAIWRPSNGYWYVLRSYTGYNPSSALKVQWGKSGDKPFLGEVVWQDLSNPYLGGAGLADLIIWRPSNGYWYALGSKGSGWGTYDDPSKSLRIQWGLSTDQPLVGGYPDSYPASGTAYEMFAFAVCRPSTGVWYVLKSTDSYDRTLASKVQWGKSGDDVLMMWPPGYLS